MVHRDLKTANILVTNGAVAKLADFGTAVLAENTANTNGVLMMYLLIHSLALPCPALKCLRVSLSTGLCGTLEWLAPELFQGIPPSFASDVWSFGCCIIEMATARWTLPVPWILGLTVRILNQMYFAIRSPWAHIKKGLEHINLLFRSIYTP